MLIPNQGTNGPSNAELVDQAITELSKTTITYKQWQKQGFTPGHWANARALLLQVK